MQKALSDGLILRSLSEGYPTDSDRLPAFYSSVFADDAEELVEVEAWIRDLISSDHPTVTADDIWVVVDPAKDDLIVSATLLIPQVWRYEDIEIPTGRPELVATLPEYRRRGLVRELFNVTHERSAALGHMIQTITGIGHYYRQFGYAMALDLGVQSTVTLEQIAARPPEQAAQYQLRPATEADIPDLVAWDAYAARHFGLSVKRDEQVWHYELSVRNRAAMWGADCQIIVNAKGEGVGYLLLRQRIQHHILKCFCYVVGEKASYLETFQDVMLALKDYVRRFDPVPSTVGFDSGIHDSLKTLISRTFTGHVQPRMYTWYIRMPDVAAFMRHIAPVLERRLEGSGAHRYTGEITISFYDSTGVKLVFEGGRLVSAENVTGLYEQHADAGFPWHTFLNVVFGHRSYTQLSTILSDVYTNPKAHVLFDILFPLTSSSVFPQT